MIPAASPKLAACPEAEVCLSLVESKLDGLFMSLAGEMLESSSRGVEDSSSEVSAMVPKSHAMPPEPILPIAVASVGLFDVPRDDSGLATGGPVSPQSLVSVGPASPVVVSFSPTVEEAPIKTHRKSSRAKGLLR